MQIDSLSKKHEMDEKELSCHLNEINALKVRFRTLGGVLLRFLFIYFCIGLSHLQQMASISPLCFDVDNLVRLTFYNL